LLKSIFVKIVYQLDKRVLQKLEWYRGLYHPTTKVYYLPYLKQIVCTS